MATVCKNRLPQDEEIAKKLNNIYPANAITLLRGIYEEKTGKELDVSNIDEAANAVKNLCNSLIRESLDRSSSIGTNLASVQKQMLESFTSQERMDRTTMIASLFSSVVDGLSKIYPSVSRIDIINGFEYNGNKVGGQAFIFNEVFKSLLKLYSAYDAMPNGTGKIKADKLSVVFENWSALVTYAKVKLRMTEGIKLGNEKDFAALTDSDNFSDEVLEELVDITESVREHWQESYDRKSFFGSIGNQVKIILSNLNMVEIDENGNIVTQTIKDKNGNTKVVEVPVRDNLGFARKMDPLTAQRMLTGLLHGARGSENMMVILGNAIEKYPQYAVLKPLYSRLSSNAKERTLFHNALRHGLQLYGTIDYEQSKDSKNVKIKTRILNERKYVTSFVEARKRVKSGKTVSDKSVYNNEGKIVNDNLKSITDALSDAFGFEVGKMKETVSSGNILSRLLGEQEERKDNKVQFTQTKYYKEYTPSQQRKFLHDTLRSLGFNVSMNTVSDIMTDNKAHREIVRLLSSLFSKGIPSVTNNNTKASELFSAKNTKNDLMNIASLLDSKSSIFGYESKIQFADTRGKIGTYYTLVTPSYMDDVLQLIETYIKCDDKKGLKTFLENHFLQSSYFRINIDGKPKILHQWIADMYEACNRKEHLSAILGDKMQYIKLLGSQEEFRGNTSFEDFTEKQHWLSLLLEFDSDRQQNKRGTALYPIFVLGDSGVQKFIRQERYGNNDTIINFIYNVFLQEVERMKLTDAIFEHKEKVDTAIEEGNNPGDNAHKFKDGDFRSLKENKNKFTILSFLNDYGITKNSTEDEAKAAISEHLNNGYEEFKSELQKQGLLEMTEETVEDTVNGEKTSKKVTLYKYFPHINNEENMDKFLKNAYFNLKFANIEQIQFMTVDPVFYNGSEDIQKRYKEIHAPGNILDLDAVDYDGNKYSENGYERCVYFEDLQLSSEEVHNTLWKLLKNKLRFPDKILKKYKKNSLTDGQGYRSLDGYRRVLGMSGQWTPDMENAYKTIKSIREQRDNNIITSEEATKRIGELSVVFQPIKPFLFTHEKVDLGGSVLYVPVQHKYAEVCLIPELLPEGKLKDLSQYMEDNNLDMVCSTKCVKVGSFGAANIDSIENEQGETDKEKLYNAMNKGEVHNLSYGDYRIQTNVPEHTYDSRLFGTQIRKLIMKGISKFDKQGKLNNGKKYDNYIPTKKKEIRLTRDITVRPNGRNILTFYSGLITAQILSKQKDFEKTISSVEKVSKMLIQNTISNDREAIDNINAYMINEFGDMEMPLFEGSLEHDSSALLLSHFKKMVNKLLIQGGSAVQASALGIGNKTEAGDLDFIYEYEKDDKGNYVLDENNERIPVNIVGIECEMPFDFSYTDSKGNTIELEYDDYVNPDGTPKLNEKGTPLIEDKFPGILNVIAYRIPTERCYSMLNMRVKRFSRKVLGGTIKVPLECTTISGFDFDIDKLYFIRKGFSFSRKRVYDKLDDEKKGEIWHHALFDLHPSYGNELRTIRENDSSSNKKHLNEYWDQGYFANDVSREEVFEEAAKDLGIDLQSYHDEEILSSEYDYEKSILDNNYIQRNNALFNLIRQRLMDPDTLEERLTPGGFTNLEDASHNFDTLDNANPSDLNDILNDTDSVDEVQNKLDELADKHGENGYKQNYDITEPATLIYYNQQQQVAAKLIGIFANHNVNYAFSSSMRSFFLTEGNEIEFAGHTRAEGYGFDLINAPQGVDVENNLAELLAGSVDAPKNPILHSLGLNILTADTFALLTRLGYKPFEISCLLNQPIIKEVCDYAFNNDLTLDDAIIDITKRYNEKLGSMTYNVDGPSFEESSIKSLVSNIIKGRDANIMEMPSFIRKQLELLVLFKKASNTATELNSFIQATRWTASNSVKSSIGEMYAQQMKVVEYINRIGNENYPFSIDLGDDYVKRVNNPTANVIPSPSPVRHDESVLELSTEDYFNNILWNPFAVEQCMYDMNVKALHEINKNYPYERYSYKGMREYMQRCTRRKILKGETINSIHRDFTVYMLSKQLGGDFYNDRQVNFTLEGHEFSCNSMSEYFILHFPSVLLSEIENWKANNPNIPLRPLFAKMAFVDGGENKPTSIILRNATGNETYTKNDIMEDWADLANDNPKLAKELFLYCFYKAGYDYNSSTFMSYAPIAVKQLFELPDISNEEDTIPYSEFLTDILKGSIIEDNFFDFYMQYIQNHPNDRSLIYHVKSNVAKKEFKTVIEDNNGRMKNEFTVDITGENVSDNLKSLIIYNANKKSAQLAPAIMYKNKLYIATNPLGITSSGKMTYKQIDKVSDDNPIRLYGPSNPITKEAYNANISNNDFAKNDSMNSLFGNNNTNEDDDANVLYKKYDRKDMIDFIDDMEKKANLEDNYRVLGIIGQAVSEKSDEDIKKVVEEIYKEKENVTIIWQDSEGNSNVSC